MPSVRTWIRFGRLLSLVLWIGGIAFFAFAVAPIAFGRLPSAHEAGIVVGATLRVLHLLGLVCGSFFLLLTLTIAKWINRRVLVAEGVLLLTMLAATAVSQFAVLPAMEADRLRSGGDIAAVESGNQARIRFERLHKFSERMEGAVLFCGLALLFGVASEPGTAIEQSGLG